MDNPWKCASPSNREATVRSADNYGLSWGWAIAAIGALIYGSLIPFDIDLTRIQRGNGFGLQQMTLSVGGLEDILTNVLCYIPIGFILATCRARRGATRLGRFFFAAVVGTALSVALEALQTGVTARIASWPDVACNHLGCLIGAFIGVACSDIAVRCIPRPGPRLAARPLAAVVAGLTIGLFLYNLAPFDFVTSTGALHASFLNAQWSMAARHPALFGPSPLASVIEYFTGAAWITLLAYARGWAQLERGRHPTVAFGSAVKHTMILVVVIEFMQLFTRSHVFEFAAIAVGSLGAVLGAWSAAYLATGSSASPVQRQGRCTMPTIVLVLLAAFQIAALLIPSIDFWTWSASNVTYASIHWMPFRTLWLSPMPDAACEITGMLLTYGTLTVTLGMILRRLRVSPPWILAGAGAISVSLLVESLNAVTISQVPDLTAPVLAAVASILAARTYLALRPILAPQGLAIQVR